MQRRDAYADAEEHDLYARDADAEADALFGAAEQARLHAQDMLGGDLNARGKEEVSSGPPAGDEDIGHFGLRKAGKVADNGELARDVRRLGRLDRGRRRQCQPPSNCRWSMGVSSPEFSRRSGWTLTC